ncbi:MAG: hypothetical protein LBI70_03805 [Rickettsiales bacterium]|jgi:hypothetical protein|nr:hypothetical protein [Rickettsiales bacterium]
MGGVLETTPKIKIDDVENMHGTTKEFLVEWYNYRMEKGAHIYPKYIDMTQKYLWENAEIIQRTIAGGRSLEDIMGALVRYNKAQDHKYIFPFPKNLGWNEIEQYFSEIKVELPKTPEEIEQFHLDWYRKEVGTTIDSPLGYLEEKIVRTILEHKSTYGELKEIAHCLRITAMNQQNHHIELCFVGYGGSVVGKYLYNFGHRVGLIAIVSDLLALDKDSIDILDTSYLLLENRRSGENPIDFCQRFVNEKRNSLLYACPN